MPKRAKTPPPADGAKFLTVVGPYPAHPNMELEQHRREFARWIGSIAGPDYLWAFYHKPTSPGSIIIEVDENFPDFKRLLGAHKWSEFLVEPGDESRFVSKVFYCTYNSDRDVQKKGWKRIDVEDKWFKSKAIAKFVSPYPPTHWCEVPPERDIIHNPLCRPLPRGDFPAPPEEPSPVVGTVEWQEWKRRQKAPQPQVTSWTRRNAPTTNNIAVPATPPGLPPPATSTQSTGSNRSDATPAAIPRRAWTNANAPLTPPGLPVGIARAVPGYTPSQGSGNGWDGTPSQISPVETSSSGTTSGDDIPPQTPADNVPIGGVQVGGRIEQTFAALSMDDDDEFYYSVGDGSVAGDDVAEPIPIREADMLLLPRADAVFVVPPKMDSKTNSLNDDDEDEEGEENDEVDTSRNPELCPEHNVVCKKGICKTYAARLRALERERRQKERQQARADALARREQNAQKRAKDGLPPPHSPATRPGPSAPSREPPPHLRPGAPPISMRALPAHLKPGASPPSVQSATRQMLPHLTRGVSSGSPTSPFPTVPAAGKLTPTPSQSGKEENVRSAKGAWDNVSEGPWGPILPAKPDAGDAVDADVYTHETVLDAWMAPTPAPNWGDASSVSPHQSETRWGAADDARVTGGKGKGRGKGKDKDKGKAQDTSLAWGKAPSITSSTARRNNESWSVSDARSAAGGGDDWTAHVKSRGTSQYGAWGKAPSVTSSSARRNNGSWSVSDARSAAGDGGDGWTAHVKSRGASQYGAWGKAPSVTSSAAHRNHDSWSVSARDEDKEDDARSVVAASDNWGRPSSVARAGPRRTWAEEMDDEDGAHFGRGEVDDDARSVAESMASGW